MFKGMPTNWVRFKNMTLFVTYMKSECGQNKLKVNVTVEEIVNLPVIKGLNCLKIQEFYESVSRN